jgi:hypothetical protein
MIDLVDCFGVKVPRPFHRRLKSELSQAADSKTRKQFSFEISSSDDNVLMCAESEREKDEWIQAIARCFTSHTPLHSPSQCDLEAFKHVTK